VVNGRQLCRTAARWNLTRNSLSPSDYRANNFHWVCYNKSPSNEGDFSLYPPEVAGAFASLRLTGGSRKETQENNRSRVTAEIFNLQHGRHIRLGWHHCSARNTARHRRTRHHQAKWKKGVRYSKWIVSLKRLTETAFTYHSCRQFCF
jgi:hypothetical protein